MATLSIKTFLDTAGITSGVQAASKSLAGVTGSVKGFMGSVAGAAGGLAKTAAGITSLSIAAGQGIPGIAGLATGFIAFGGPVGAVVGSLMGASRGISAFIEQGWAASKAQGGLMKQFGLSAEAAGGLSFAIESTGGNMDEARVGMGVLSRNLGAVRAGSESARAEFRALGLDGDALASMPLDQALGQIGDRMNGLTNPAERTRLAFTLFGRNFQGMLPILRQGTAGIAAAAAESQNLGLTSSAEEIAANLAAMRAWNSASAVTQMLFSDIAENVAIRLAPFIMTASAGLRSWIPSIATFTGFLATAFGDVLSTAFSLIQGLGPLFSVALEAGLVPLRAIGLAWNWIRETAMSLAEALAPAFESGMAAILDVFGALEAVAESLGDVLLSMWPAIKEVALPVLGAIVLAIGFLLDMALQGFGKLFEMLSEIPGRVGESFGRLNNSIQGVRDSIRQAGDNLMNLDRIQAERQIAADPAMQLQSRLRALTAGGDQFDVAGGIDRAVASGNLQALEAVAQAAQAAQAAGHQIAGGGFNQELLDRINTTVEGLRAMNEVEGELGLANAQLTEDISKLEQGWRGAADTIGMTADEVKLFELKQRGATDAMLENARAALTMRNAADATRQVRQPFEETTEQMRRMFALWEGDAELADDTFGLHLLNIANKAESVKNSLPGAILSGSSAAVSAINKFNQSNTPEDPTARLLAVLNQQRQRQERQIELARQLVEGVRDNRAQIAEFIGN